MRAIERWQRVREMVRKEFIQVRRDPRLWRVIVIAPIIQLVVFGYAVSTDVRRTRTFVVDHDATRASRDLVSAFTASEYFRVVESSERPADLVRALDHGEVVAGLEIPVGFARSLAEGQEATVQILLDGSNSNDATIASGYAERIVTDFGARLNPTVSSGGIDLRERAWFNPSLASRNYNVPGVVGLIVSLVCLLLTALAVVREREIGTLEQLMISPLTPSELIIGKTLPFALMGLLDLALVTTVGILWFGVPFRGSWLLFLLASVLYLVSGLGLGLLISTVSSTQQQAFMVNFLIFMPIIMLSGFMFPISSMPVSFEWLTLLNPLRHYLVIVRSVFLQGAGLDALWPQCLWLLGLGVAVLGFAASRFRKTTR